MNKIKKNKTYFQKQKKSNLICTKNNNYLFFLELVLAKVQKEICMTYTANCACNIHACMSFRKILYGDTRLTKTS